jgi:NADH-quinone oxidoreductase subunit J
MIAADLLVAQNVGFGIISLLMIIGAVRVVTVSNVVHAALWLVIVLSGAAAQYLLLSAEFVAITQVLVYVGAVMVLFLFGTMLTRARIGAELDLNNKNWFLGIPVALLMLGVMSYVIVDGFGSERLIDNSGDMQPIPVQLISDDIFGPYLLPFWALSFVLLVAVIGAIVLARKD